MIRIGLSQRLTLCYLEKKGRTKGNGNWHARRECTTYSKSTEYIFDIDKKKGLISIVNYAQRWELFRYANLHRGGTI